MFPCVTVSEFVFTIFLKNGSTSLASQIQTAELIQTTVLSSAAAKTIVFQKEPMES